MAIVIRGVSANEAEVTASNALKVLPMQSATSTTALGQGRYEATALGSLNAELILNTDGISNVGFQIFGTFAGTLSFYGTADGVNLFLISAANVVTLAPSTSTTAVGAFYISSAYKNVIIRMTAYTSGVAEIRASLQPFGATLPVFAPTATLLAGASSGSAVIGSVRLAGAPLTVSTTGVAGAAVTLRLPSGGANNFHYISHLRLEAHASATVTAGPAPIAITTTNLNGSLFYMANRALAQGDFTEKVINFSEAMRTQTANAAATFIMPATPNIIWAAFANYRTGA